MIDNNKYSTFSMSIPIVFQSFFQILFGLVDIGFLSFCSDTVVASVGYANQIISVILLAYIIISSAVSIVGAQYIGEKRIEDTYALSKDAIISSIIISLFVTTVLLISKNYIMDFLDIPVNMRNGTSTYFSVISVGLLFQGGNTVFTSIYRIYAKGSYAMFIGILINILNILGDACVVFNPLKYDYDYIFGVALATVISNFIGFFLMLYYYNRRIKIKYKFRYLLSISNVKILIKYGVPAAGENISYKISQLVVTVFLTSLGSYILTSKIYAMNIMLFVSLIPNSIGIATGIIVGYLFGKKKYDVLYKKCYENIKTGLIIVVVLDFIVIKISDFILKIFTQNEDIIKVAQYIIYLEAITLFVKVGNFMFSNSLKGVGDVYYCVILSIISMWIFGVGMAYVLGISLKFGIVGIYIAFLFDEIFRCIFMWKRWKRKKFTETKISELSLE